MSSVLGIDYNLKDLKRGNSSGNNSEEVEELKENISKLQKSVQANSSHLSVLHVNVEGNVKDISELQKDVADLQSNSETSLKNIVVKEETIKNTSNSLKLEDTANCLIAKIVSIESNKLEQENRQGYNLLNFDFNKTTINGLTFTPNRKQFT